MLRTKNPAVTSSACTCVLNISALFLIALLRGFYLDFRCRNRPLRSLNCFVRVCLDRLSVTCDLSL
jgi:hypothetical protein